MMYIICMYVVIIIIIQINTDAILCLCVSGLEVFIINSGVDVALVAENSTAALENKKPIQQSTYHMC